MEQAKYVPILSSNYLNRDRSAVNVGGVPPYLTALVPVIRNSGYEPVIYQFSERDFETEFRQTRVVGLGVPSQSLKHKVRLMTDEVQRRRATGDIVLFGSDIFIPNHRIDRSIAIQHGIYWDIPKRINVPVGGENHS